MSGSRVIASVLLSLACLPARADGEKGKWVNISDPLVAKLTAEGKKPGFPGQTAGVAVDPASGDLFVVVAGLGLYRSNDRGATFERCDGGRVGGRCETSCSINVDPAGSRMACFMLDGKCAWTADAGRTWQPMADVGRNWDYAAVDWPAAPGEAPAHVFALRHESGGEIYLSHDAGKTWPKIGKDAKFAACGIFDERTLVTTKGEGILRSTDGGTTWEKVSDLQPLGRVVRIYHGTAYWLGKDGLLLSKDKGATWTKQGTAVAASIGPFFKDEQHLIAAGKAGIYETRDGGQAWTLAAPLPEGFDVPQPGWFTNVAWDTAHDVFYASKMGKPAYKWER